MRERSLTSPIEDRPVNRLLAFFISCGLLVGVVNVAEAAAPRPRITNGPDVITGTAGADRYNGLRGDDKIFGGPGNDTLTGGPGKDYISGGAGNDRINARDGEVDTIYCGTGKKDVVIRDKMDRVSRDCYDRR